MLPAKTTGAEQLVLEEAPLPEPGRGEVGIRVRAVSINFRDQLILVPAPFGRLPGRDLVPALGHGRQIKRLSLEVDR